jgi:excisionase family DNA binding protein
MSAEFFTPETLAEYLSVPVATCRKWRHNHEGPPGFRVGRHVRYRRRDVEAWIEELERRERRPAEPRQRARIGGVG